jgi:uncharacterized membrane protein YfcA
VSLVVHDGLAILTGLVVGVLAGVMGIGGGILLVPVMVLGFGYTQHVAQGTSLAAIVPTSIVGAYTHDRAGNVDRKAALWVSSGGVGALLGALVAVHAPPQLLVRLFGGLLLFSAYRIWATRRPKVD